MKPTLFKSALLILLVLLLSASPCWAKAKGYCFVVGYSYKLKQAFFSKVFSQDVRDVSYSDEEYTTDVVLIQKMESQFQAYLSSTQNVESTKYTITARGAYKDESIAMRRLVTERDNFKKKGFKTAVLQNFTLR
jgi:hypothetical protein